MQQIERLQRLDNEMLAGKNFDYLTAVRRDVRIKIGIFRRESGDFKAGATVGGRIHYSIGDKPSYAFAKLIRQIRYKLDQMTVDANFVNGVSKRLAA